MITLSPMGPYDIQMLHRLFPRDAHWWGHLDIVSEAHVALVAYTDEHAFLAAGGIHQIDEGYGYCWMVTTPLQSDLLPHRLRLFYTMRHVFVDAYIKHGYRRLEAHTGLHDVREWRVLEFLGFRREGHLRQFFRTGDDAYLYGWVNESI